MMSSQIEFHERQTAFRSRLRTFATVNIEHIDLRTFLRDSFHYFSREINQIIEQQFLVKVNAIVKLIFTKENITEEGSTTEHQTIFIHTKTSVVDFETDLNEFYNEMIVDYILHRVDDVIIRGSGFALTEIHELLVQVNQFEPISGSSYIPLPKFLQNKKAIINVKNEDQQCFKYAILSAIFPVTSNAQLVSSYIHNAKKVNFEGLTFPVDLKSIGIFEKRNPTISINVYMFNEDKDKIHTLRLTKDPKTTHIHLLLLTNANTTHFCWIKNLSRLISKQTSSNTRKKHYCDRCLNHFSSEMKLNEHRVACFSQNKCVTKMPTWDDNTVRFTNYKNQLQVPFIVYADIETLLKEPEDKQPSGGTSTKAYQEHEPYSVGYYFKCMHDDSKSYYKSRRDKDCIAWFVKELYFVAAKAEIMLNNIIPLQMSIKDEVLFAMTQECEICGKTYDADDVRVRDHSHLTGKYRGSAHKTYNLIYQESRNIPIVFHNLTNYDSHFLMKKIATAFDGDISVIPLTDQQYISFTKTVPSLHSNDYSKFIRLRFIDSFRFMASSLDQLTSLLPSDKKRILHNECSKDCYDTDQIKMLERKGVLCYDYIDSWQRLDETSLPSMSNFHNQLNCSDVTDEQYDFAVQVWKKFNITNLGEYTDIYLKTDVLLLADVFENFRQSCYDIYGLDPAHYFTAPSLSFDAMLKYTKVRIELLTDIDMHMFVERGVRGGISQCSKRYSKANNAFMEDFDSNSETKYLMYLDANNLYGHSMTQFLPLDDFAWTDPFNTEFI